jgi:hypothetical protein
MFNPTVIWRTFISVLFFGILCSEYAAAQVPNGSSSASVARVKEALTTTPARSLKLDARMPVPAATFRVNVEQHAFVVPILESLRKEFELTPLQRQSADWASKCCGLNLLSLMDRLDRTLQDFRERRARERVARELAEVAAAANNK